MQGTVDVIVGLQRGDEGKGRFVDAQTPGKDFVARFNGGSNAGHTVVLPDGRDLALHLIPSGIAHEGVENIIGNGTFVDPNRLVKEIASVEAKGISVSPNNLKLDGGAHLTLPHHVFDDMLREGGAKAQGTTKAGIAQTAADKGGRTGSRVEMILSQPYELYDIVARSLEAQRQAREAAGLTHFNGERINEREITDRYLENCMKVGVLVTDTVVWLNRALESGAHGLAEAAQAYGLDLNHGAYPDVTSSSTTSGGVAPGLGIPPRRIGQVIGVAKAIQSHVGGGHFVTEIHDEKLLKQMHGDPTAIDGEQGTTTGRTRRLGWLDAVSIRRANMVNGTDWAALTKLDWMSNVRCGEELKVCTSYEKDGERLDIAPSSAHDLKGVTPIYATLPSWKEDIQHVRDWKKLPRNAQRYVEFVEEEIGTPIKMIGVGPARDQVIIRD